MKIVEVKRPPIRTTAMPDLISLEAPRDRARGIVPTIIVTDVVESGRPRDPGLQERLAQCRLPRLTSVFV